MQADPAAPSESPTPTAPPPLHHEQAIPCQPLPTPSGALRYYDIIVFYDIIVLVYDIIVDIMPIIGMISTMILHVIS